VNKPDRDAERDAIWAAYESRIQSGDYDLRAGFAALHLFMGVPVAYLFIFVFLPLGLLQLSESYIRDIELLQTIVTLVILGGAAYNVFRVLIPVGFDFVWRMDVLSDRIGFVRPDDVVRLFTIWVSPSGLGVFLRRRWSRNA
jgi:hypothetical protein